MLNVDYVAIAVGAVSTVAGGVTWAFNLKVKHEILSNNTKLEKEIGDMKDRLSREIGGVNDNYVREFSAFKERMTDRFEILDHDMTELKTSLNDRILSTVNGKYVRTDLHQQTIVNVQERLQSFKQLIEVNMEKIEQSLDKQIMDLKERIFHDK